MLFGRRSSGAFSSYFFLFILNCFYLNFFFLSFCWFGLTFFSVCFGVWVGNWWSLTNCFDSRLFWERNKKVKRNSLAWWFFDTNWWYLHFFFLSHATFKSVQRSFFFVSFFMLLSFSIVLFRLLFFIDSYSSRGRGIENEDESEDLLRWSFGSSTYR